MRASMNGLDIVFGSDTYSRLRANLGAGGSCRPKLPSLLSRGSIGRSARAGRSALVAAFLTVSTATVRREKQQIRQFSQRTDRLSPAVVY